jgi:hypothetical protein
MCLVGSSDTNFCVWVGLSLRIIVQLLQLSHRLRKVLNVGIRDSNKTGLILVTDLRLDTEAIKGPVGLLL